MINLMKRIAIIGGGASGMMAAVTAAGLGCAVTIYEHKDRVGKKLLSTGNGKCNFTNRSVCKDDYRGNHPSFVVPILKAFPPEAVLAFFEKSGLFWKEKNGCVYPVTNQASTVLDLFRRELKRLSVDVVTECGKISVKALYGRREEGFEVVSQKGRQICDCVIVATGSKAAPSTGSDGSGYAIARSMGHTIIPLLPALTSLKGNEAFFQPVAGVRVDADVSLYVENAFCMKESGELQLTAHGPSGIVIFQLSRFAIKALYDGKKVWIVCDLLPHVTQQQLNQSVCARRLRGLSAEEALIGIVNKKLLLWLLPQSGIKPSADAGSLTKQQLLTFAQYVKNCRMEITGYSSFDAAQVCQGGVDTAFIHDNLESKLQKGLYFAGEVIDIDGKCGGYNLQWAWSSGYVAARAAAGKGSPETDTT